MALPKDTHNTYEEHPDQAKEFIKNTPDEKGQRPRSKVSRDTLLRTHQRHLKFLSEGSVLPVRNLILPRPYPPARCTVPATSSNTVGTTIRVAYLHSVNESIGSPWRSTY
jgi:hypothetical protein